MSVSGNVSVSAESNTAVVTILEPDAFKINNQTVKGASITGADVNFDNGIANVTIPSGTDNNFTDAYKNKLDSIESGAQANRLNGIVVSGADYEFNTATKIANITISGADVLTVNGAEVSVVSITGADVNITSDTAIVSISGGDKFSINGAESNAMSLVGGVQEYDSSTQITNVTIPAGITGVSVQGAGNGSISADGKTLLITLTGNEGKLSPDFSLTPAGVTLPAYQGSATITASYLGDGLVSPIDTVTAKGFEIVQKDANHYQISGSKAGNHDLGFCLSDTATYYGAARNVNVEILPAPTPPILLHFNDAENPFLNSGVGGELEVVQGDNNVTISSEYGQFGNDNGAWFAYSGSSSELIPTILKATNPLVTYSYDQDFTLDFRARASSWKCRLGIYNTNPASWIEDSRYNQHFSVLEPSGANAYCYMLGNGFRANNATEWGHWAFCYDSTERKGYAFYNGVLQQTVTTGVEFGGGVLQLEFRNVFVDELRYIPVCAWKDNFTPPSEPY